MSSRQVGAQPPTGSSNLLGSATTPYAQPRSSPGSASCATDPRSGRVQLRSGWCRWSWQVPGPANSQGRRRRTGLHPGYRVRVCRGRCGGTGSAVSDPSAAAPGSGPGDRPAGTPAVDRTRFDLNIGVTFGNFFEKRPTSISLLVFVVRCHRFILKSCARFRVEVAVHGQPAAPGGASLTLGRLLSKVACGDCLTGVSAPCKTWLGWRYCHFLGGDLDRSCTGLAPLGTATFPISAGQGRLIRVPAKLWRPSSWRTAGIGGGGAGADRLRAHRLASVEGGIPSC